MTNRQTVRVAWGDCDAAGIVFFPRYFEWFDAATHALFERVGLSFAGMSERYPGITIPLAATRARFARPSTYGDDVVIETAISRWGRSSFDVTHRLLRPGGSEGSPLPAVEEVAVECVETRVWTLREAGTLHSRAIPPEVIELFNTGETATP